MSPNTFKWDRSTQLITIQNNTITLYIRNKAEIQSKDKRHAHYCNNKGNTGDSRYISCQWLDFRAVIELLHTMEFDILTYICTTSYGRSRSTCFMFRYCVNLWCRASKSAVYGICAVNSQRCGEGESWQLNNSHDGGVSLHVGMAMKLAYRQVIKCLKRTIM